jgi:hypothetical protein
MRIEIRTDTDVINTDLPAVPAPGELITRYEHESGTEVTMRVTARRWVIDANTDPMVVIRAELIERATSTPNG